MSNPLFKTRFCAILSLPDGEHLDCSHFINKAGAIKCMQSYIDRCMDKHGEKLHVEIVNLLNNNSKSTILKNY